MKNSLIFGTAIVLTTLGFSTFSASAQQTAPVYSQSGYQTATIPQSAAIVVVFPDEVSFRVRKNQNQPVTLRLMQPVLDSSGNIIAPANSPVRARLVPVDRKRGMQIQAEAIVAGGIVIPVQAISDTVPNQRIRKPDADARAEHNIQMSSRFRAALNGGRAQPDIDQIDTAVVQGGYSGAATAMLGNAISDALGSNNITVASFERGSVWVLTLQAPVIASVAPIPQPMMSQQFQGYVVQGVAPDQVLNPQSAPSAMQQQTSLPQTMNGLQNLPDQNSTLGITETRTVQQQYSGVGNQPLITQQSSASMQSAFNFRNPSQYSDTIEQVLTRYQQGQISDQQAQQTVVSADRFATTQLSPPLYPFKGVRQRVTERLGFTYGIDR